ncbi:SprB repeat-containing protein [Arsenicibacter rosenii]|uniref:SprB repeat-containing protein n=1 Tax=Arsenicibacter rosenii TaxID=1750698 RepID=UPI0015A5CA19|nr:SprB repeat-containing protein [Arsenicibacter rosenii]
MLPAEQFEILYSSQNIRCKNDSTGAISLYILGGYEPYQYNWSDGITTQNRTTLAAGTYSVTVTDAVNTSQTLSVSIDPGISPEPTFRTIAATCAGGAANQDGQLVLASFSATDRYDFSQGATYTGSADAPGTLPVIPADGIINRNQPNPAATQAYTVRVFNERGCFTDVTAALPATSCQCQTSVCVPITIRRLR